MLTFSHRLTDQLRQLYTDYRVRADVQDNLRKSEIILVHQMGKVGSTSIVQSLEALDLEAPIYHTHSLDIEHLKARETYKRSHRQRIPPRVLEGQYIRQAFDKGLDSPRWKVITLVREPITRNISAFFQNVQECIPDFFYRYGAGDIEVAEIIDVFLHHFDHDVPLTWFDHQVKAVFDIDIFATDFDKSQGYKIFNGHRADLLLIRLEESACKAFEEFLGL
jgi:hypothetical protein